MCKSIYDHLTRMVRVDEIINANYDHLIRMATGKGDNKCERVKSAMDGQQLMLKVAGIATQMQPKCIEGALPSLSYSELQLPDRTDKCVERLSPNLVDCGIQLQSQVKLMTQIVRICCFLARHSALLGKEKDTGWLSVSIM